MKIRNLCTFLFLITFFTMSAGSKPHVAIAYTTDVHGSYFPVNYITMQPAEGCLARIKTAVDSIRQSLGKENLLLLDNGDFLQGQPTVYYYNYIDTVSPHISSQIYNFMGYDATTVGNHDIETGHAVYDRWRAQNKMPMLAANVIDVKTGKPYFQPYAVFERGGLKIAVLGMLTPAIPCWLPEVLWSGLRFDDMTESARKWVPYIKETEKPDILIGLFHSGHDEQKTTGNTVENASVKVAREVAGLDAVLMGHDHQLYQADIINVDGDTVKVLNPANNARFLGLVNISFERDSKGKIKSKNLSTSLIDVRHTAPDRLYLETFAPQRKIISDFVNRRIGSADEDMDVQDAFFGPSAFMTLLHQLQLSISGADISFAAPLSFNAVIKKGPVRISDMFSLYKYENMLYTMRLTGKEIKDYLEYSYSLWTRQIAPGQGHLINFASDTPTLADNRLKNPSYNFDSAAGIEYTVDITRPAGERISIKRLSDGRAFSPDSIYTVAVNSYRANGGGDHFTKGAGIPAGELAGRVIRATERDLRYYLIKEIEKNPDIKVSVMPNWRFIPESAAFLAIETDRRLLFSEQSSKEQK